MAVLTTLIYKSQLNPSCKSLSLLSLVEKAKHSNTALDVTGILLFDGVEFLQILEGSEEVIETLFLKIREDKRHDSVVELMRDYGPRRRFENVGMLLFDLRIETSKSVRSSVLRYSKLDNYLAAEDRVFKFIQTFINQQKKALGGSNFRPEKWTLAPEHAPFGKSINGLIDNQVCQFALQPIVQPTEGKISSLEALIRSNDGGSPERFFNTIDQDKVYEVDLLTKAYAFALAEKIGIGDHKIAINLLPMSLVNIPGAVDILLAQITRHGLVPEQVIVEVTEDEVISGYDEFTIAIMQLRSAGIGLAIDDFGAGFAGLSLLTKFQPGELKIDRSIVTDIHLHGPKQAIVNAIVKCCAELEISVVAEGVEKVEEWCWLEAAGIKHFQGYLFAKPALNGVAPVCWPVKQVKA